MDFSIFTDICNHHLSILKHFYHRKKKLHTVTITSLSNPALPPKQLLVYFLDISHKWNHMEYFVTDFFH